MVPDKGPDVNQSSKLETVPTGDPFIPLRPTESKSAPLPRAEPVYSAPMQLASNRPLPSVGSQPGIGFPVAPAAPDPEIKVIGVVEGDQSIATIEVGGKARNVRPGESLARSYRLESVYGDGVRVRHDKKTYSIRVGNAINDATSKL